ncbi:uncharacterized protein LOC135819971 [Sycon ciliatum]|uniref:uncharacterized protein LOC135819971 n=1 Tax=Sycon ciliatum TaxID=27933 RepID=UPI0031F6A49D
MSKHAKSRCHKEAVDRLLTIPENVCDVGERLDSQFTAQRKENCACLLQVLRSVRFLARQGLALRGSSRSGGGECDVDNYVDDVLTPASTREAVAAELERYSLLTKPPEPPSTARVLGLQLSTSANSDDTRWSRRDCVDLAFERPLTKRGVLQWTGRLTSHYPVGAGLRPACSYLKHMASTATGWDDPVPQGIVRCAGEVVERLARGDSARGVWRVPSTSGGDWAVYCDASDLATGIVLKHNGDIVGDGTWLRDADDRKCINVAELDVAMRGLSLAVEWGLESVRLITDSKAVFGWLGQVAENACRVRVGGLHKVLIERRPDTTAEIAAPVDSTVDEAARLAVKRDEVQHAQRASPQLMPVLSTVQLGKRVEVKPFSKIRDQLVLDDGVLSRSFRLPALGNVTVPIIPESLIPREVEEAHRMSGHGSWTVIKWVEVKPLRRHDAASVAGALTSMCCRWGLPDQIQMDTETEFQNAVVRSLFTQFGVRVKTGAVRHPQSQGGMERMNRTLITLMW